MVFIQQVARDRFRSGLFGPRVIPQRIGFYVPGNVLLRSTLFWNDRNCFKRTLVQAINLSIRIVFLACVSFVSGTSYSFASSDPDKGSTAIDPTRLPKSMNFLDKKDGVMIRFAADCNREVCNVKVIIPNNKNIANFSLDYSSHFFVERHEDISAEKANRPGCANKHVIDYQNVFFDSKDGALSTELIFEVIQTPKEDGRVCWTLDTSDGPTTVTFIAGYDLSPNATIMVYEVDSYRTIKDSEDAKVKFLPSDGN